MFDRIDEGSSREQKPKRCKDCKWQDKEMLIAAMVNYKIVSGYFTPDHLACIYSSDPEKIDKCIRTKCYYKRKWYKFWRL